MSLIDPKMSFHFRERYLGCNKCGKIEFHGNMEKKEERRRKLKIVDFLRQHKNCDGIHCQNCDSAFANVNAFNRHINQCNHDNVNESVEIEEMKCDFNLDSLQKWLSKSQRNKKISKKDFIRKMNVSKHMCFQCGRNRCEANCVPLQCCFCNNKMNVFHFRKSIKITNFCRNFITEYVRNLLNTFKILN